MTNLFALTVQPTQGAVSSHGLLKGYNRSVDNTSIEDNTKENDKICDSIEV